jgi:hypothetical protein
VAQTRGRLDRFEAAAARVVRSEADKVVIEIDAFAEAGQEIREQMHNDVVRLLGPERAEAYLKQSRKQIGTELSHFGQTPQQVTVTRLESGGYLISTGLRGTTAPNIFSSYRSRKVDELPARFAELF